MIKGIARFKLLAAKQLLGGNGGVQDKGGGNESPQFKRRIETPFLPHIMTLLPKD
jgi:hypothetical protein